MIMQGCIECDECATSITITSKSYTTGKVALTYASLSTLAQLLR